MSKELQKLKARLKPLLEKAGVKQSFVFGSFARGEAKKDSDLDLIIDFNFDAGLLDLISLRIKLQKILGRKVDIITSKSISPLIKSRILKDRILIF